MKFLINEYCLGHVFHIHGNVHFFFLLTLFYCRWAVFFLLLACHLVYVPIFVSSALCQAYAMLFSLRLALPAQVWLSSTYAEHLPNEHKSAQHSICIQSVAHYTIVSNTCLEWCKCYIKYFVIQSYYMLCRNYKKSIFKYAIYTGIGWLSKHSIHQTHFQPIPSHPILFSMRVHAIGIESAFHR